MVDDRARSRVSLDGDDEECRRSFDSAMRNARTACGRGARQGRCIVPSAETAPDSL